MPSKNAAPAKVLYLVDLSSFIFRAFYAVRSLSTKKGEPVNAVYGVATMLAKLVQEARAEYVGIVFDSKEPSFRKERYPEYKANRSAPPDELLPQFDRIEALVRSMKFPMYRQAGVEADDLIGTLAVRWTEQDPTHEVVIVSGDKDLMQLVDDRVRIWDTLSNKTFRAPEVEEKFGVKPTQIRDYLALVGDSSDNIPGVIGIGPKGAVDLLKAHGDLESVLKAAQDGKVPGKKGESLKEYASDARLSAELASLKMDLKVDSKPESLQYQFTCGDECSALLAELEFHSLAKKWQDLLATTGASPVQVSSEKAPASFTPSASLVSAAPASSVSASPQISQQTSLFFGVPSSDQPAPSVSAGQIPAIPQSVLGRPEFRTVRTAAEFETLIAHIEKNKEFGFDLETTSLNPRAAEIVGIAVAPDVSAGYYIPVGHRGGAGDQLELSKVMARLKPYLEDPRYKKIGQNLKYDWSVLYENGVSPQGIGADTMVAAYVLDPEGRHNLEVLAGKYLDYPVLTFEQVCGKGKDQVPFDLVPVDLATRYSAEDAWASLALWRVLEPKLIETRSLDVFAQVDLPLVDLLARMERQGVCIDTDWLSGLSTEFGKELRQIEERVHSFTKGPVNLNSPKQLGQLLFEELKLPTQGKTKTGFSTDASVLEALAPLHEVPRLLLEYREIAKLKGTYVDPLPSLRDPKTGKIHAGFHQAVTMTGRLSSSDPNLQNIPIRSERGKRIRRAFIPSPGNVLISADYSQIELRILAHMSGDVELVKSFQKDEDVHRRTASEIYEIDPEKVDDSQRAIAKAINFGLMYGKTAFGLAQELSISRREAQDTIDRYFRRYHGVKQFLDRQIIEAKERGFTETLLGRRRYLRDLEARNPAMRAMAERMAMNTPIQGTAADLMKLAMIHLDEALIETKMSARMIIQVHDEILLDCPKSEEKAAIALVIKTLENAMTLSVPLRVNAASGSNWMEI